MSTKNILATLALLLAACGGGSGDDQRGGATTGPPSAGANIALLFDGGSESWCG